ncbi:MAG: PQQ-dependent sugar dehydrogenase, partial [Gemmatimonadota bacterium]|nr:PQQ-dependent sugar dehydrogenase [Gemmatimonadota bacterium]
MSGQQTGPRERRHGKVGLVGGFGVACVVSFLVGFAVSDQRVFPSGYLLLAKEFVKGTFVPPRPDPRLRTRSVSTGLVRLDLRVQEVPVDRPGEGGGLTSVGDELVVLTHEGGLFRTRGESIERLTVEPPENHFEAYKAEADSGRYQDLRHEFLSFRYNDVLYYEDASTGHLAISYTEWRPDLECYNNAVARLDIGSVPVSLDELVADARDWTVVFRTEPCLPLKRFMRALAGHVAGGRMAYVDPGRILLGSGDYHWDGLYGPEALAQDSDNDYGKIIDIDMTTGAARHLSRGNRNVQGILLDREGQVWAVEHGPRGGDELNRIEAGANYGWPLATLGTRYNSLPWPGARQYGRHDDFEAPVYAWVPSIGISNIIQVEGFDPGWDGDLLVSSLIAQTLFRLRLRDGRVVFSEPIEIGDRIRYAHQHTDGRIGLWASGGRLIWVSKSETSPALAQVERLIEHAGLEERRLAGLQTAIRSCMECHSFEPGNDV